VAWGHNNNNGEDFSSRRIRHKKNIALSILRQLGLIFITIGLGLPLLAFFHLISHAYFKDILFICAGRIIHRIKD
jgi:NADH-ubiquinone oxidoreductase chain 5